MNLINTIPSTAGFEEALKHLAEEGTLVDIVHEEISMFSISTKSYSDDEDDNDRKIAGLTIHILNSNPQPVVRLSPQILSSSVISTQFYLRT